MNLRMQQEMRDMAMLSPLCTPVGIRPTYGILQLLDGLIGEVLQLIARHGVCRIAICSGPTADPGHPRIPRLVWPPSLK